MTVRLEPGRGLSPADKSAYRSVSALEDYLIVREPVHKLIAEGYLTACLKLLNKPKRMHAGEPAAIKVPRLMRPLNPLPASQMSLQLIVWV